METDHKVFLEMLKATSVLLEIIFEYQQLVFCVDGPTVFVLADLQWFDVHTYHAGTEEDGRYIGNMIRFTCHLSRAKQNKKVLRSQQVDQMSSWYRECQCLKYFHAMYAVGSSMKSVLQ